MLPSSSSESPSSASSGSWDQKSPPLPPDQFYWHLNVDDLIDIFETSAADASLAGPNDYREDSDDDEEITTPDGDGDIDSQNSPSVVRIANLSDAHSSDDQREIRGGTQTRDEAYVRRSTLRDEDPPREADQAQDSDSSDEDAHLPKRSRHF